jgi:hypothetical protein
VNLGGDEADSAVIRCSSCNARLGTAAQFRAEPFEPSKLRARRIG